MALISALALTALTAPDARAQSERVWPPKTVRIIVPFGPGSTPDIVARLISDRLGRSHPDTTFIVENKPGAGGNLGTDAVAKAAPDGATIGVSIGGPLAVNPLIVSNLPYRPERDIAPISQLITQPSALAVGADLPVRSVQELIVLMRSQPDKFNYSSIGIGSLSHLTMEAIALAAHVRLVHVPYSSSPQAMTAIIRNDAQMACLPAASVAPLAADGKVRILAVSTAQRSPYLKDIPTLKEAGIDVEADAWMGLIAPRRTPKAVIAQIGKDVAAIMKLPDIRDKLAAQLMEPVGSTPEEFGAVIQRETSRWKAVIDAAHIKIN